MKRALVPVLIVALLAPVEALAHRHKPAEVIESLARAWDDHKADAMADLFTDDADVSYPYRSFVVGRANIQRLLASEHEGRMRESTLQLVGEPRFRGDACRCLIVDHDATLSGIRDLEDQRLVISALVVQTKLARTVEEKDEWSIASLRLIPQSRDERASSSPR